MKKYINNNLLKELIITFSSIILLEIIFKIINFYPLLDWSILRIIYSTIIISLIVNGILYFIKKSLHKYIILILFFIITIYAFIQTGFNNFIGVYMSLGASSQLGAVIDYIREFLLSFHWYYYFILLPFILVISYYIFIDKSINKKLSITKEKQIIKIKSKKLWENVSIYIIVICLVSGFYYSTLLINFMQPKLQTITNRKLFKNPSVPSISIKQFGITMYGLLDVKNYFIPSEIILDINYINNKHSDSNKVESRSIDDTNWNKLIETENNNNLNNLNKYFISQNITEKNSYTGLFKKKNLIVIMLESVNDIIINEKDYPNFYKMYSEGWHWSNNYSPRNSCSTGNNEMSGMISLYSIYNTCTANNYKENEYYESIFNLFNNKKYNTFSAHDYTEHYYYRNTIHTNMGSQKYYGVEELGIDYRTEYKNWASDEDFMNSVLNILDSYDDENKFMSWLTTVSSHQPYYYSSIEGDKYYSLYENEDIRTDLKRYKSKLKILDNALGILIKGLEERNILDDTVIVMFGDHYPYGLSNSTINSVLDYDTNIDYETERVPFVIYNTKIEAHDYIEYTSYINILPTLANLFDLNYDPRLYMGNDLLSSDYESLVVFADGSWKNEKAFYNASTSNIEFFTDKKYSNEEIIEINNKIDAKIKMSSLAIKNNYFKYLHDNIIKNKNE